MKKQHKTTDNLPRPGRLSCRFVSSGSFAGSHDVDWHVHGEHEIILVTAGRSRMSAGRDLWFEAGPGSVIILPAGLEQYHQSQEFTRDIYLCFHAAPSVFIPHPRLLQVPPGGLCATLFVQINELALSPAAAVAQPVLNALLLALLEEVNRQEHQARDRAALHPAVQRAVAFMETNLDRALTVTEIAGRAAVSPSHLTALFRQEFRQPPLKIHISWRLELAARLLRGRHARGQEVAAATGFMDANYFTRQFRAHFGMTPTAWVKRNENGPCPRPVA